MAEYTTHYNLKKPAKNENYNIDVANQNNDIIDEKLYGKVDKKAGKDLSTNDFTNEYKKKLDTLKNYDDAEVIKQITSFNERAGKVEEANTEISKNVEALKTDNETNKTAISELKETTAQNSETITAIQEEQTTQNENIEKNAEGIAQNKKDVDEELTKIKKENSLLKSQIPEGHASGNNIHLEDSSNMDFEWKLRCGSRQATRSGKNVFDNTVEPQFISNAKKEIINTGERIILTAKTFSYAIFKVEKNIREYAGKTVRLKMDFSKSNANLNPKYGVLLGSSDYSNREVKGESTVSGYTITFNLPSELENEKEYLFVRLYATQNNEGNIENYVDYTNIILTIDNENMSYEAFGVSPSPEFPSKIENVENDVKMTVYNKNLFDGNFTTNGIWNDDGSINYVVQSKLYWRTDFIKIPNTKIYFSDKMISRFSSAILLEFDADKKYITSNKIYQINSSLNKVSLNENTRFIAIQWNLQNATEIEGLFTDFQIEVGSTASPYISHQEQTIIFPLAEGQKLYAGSYLAEDGIHNTRKQIVLTGNENWERDNTIDTTKTILFKANNNIVNNTNVNEVTFKSNYFIHKRWIDSIYKKLDEPYISQTEITNLYININKDVLASLDVEGLKAWLSEHNVIVEYPLAEEEIIPYIQEQKNVIDKILYTYKNVTNISVDDELATLDITYKKDIETMFNNQAKEYNERLSNIENLLNTTSTSALLLDNLENDLKEEV